MATFFYKELFDSLALQTAESLKQKANYHYFMHMLCKKYCNLREY